MADYSNFPFGDYTAEEVFALARASKEIDDDEFARACLDAIVHGLCKPAEYFRTLPDDDPPGRG